MGPGLQLARVWYDEDLVELRIIVSVGACSFSNTVYAWRDSLADAVAALRDFNVDPSSGSCELRFGGFGSKYAGGAFHARLQYSRPGRLCVSCEQETDFSAFADGVAASRATLHWMSEPALLDRFIAEFHALAALDRAEAYLEAVGCQ